MEQKKEEFTFLHVNNCTISQNNILLDGHGQGIWLYGSQSIIAENVVRNGIAEKKLLILQIIT